MHFDCTIRAPPLLLITLSQNAKFHTRFFMTFFNNNLQDACLIQFQKVFFSVRAPLMAKAEALAAAPAPRKAMLPRASRLSHLCRRTASRPLGS
jgi:hypothetical protein